MTPGFENARRPISLTLLLLALLAASGTSNADARHYGKWNAIKMKQQELRAHKVKRHRSHRVRLYALEERIDVLEESAADVGALYERIGALEASVAALQAGFDTLDDIPGRLAVLESEVSALNAALAGVSGDVSALTSRVSNVEAALATLAGLEARIAALEAGGGGGGGGGPTDFFIDCAAGDSINAALAAGDPSRPLTINVSGNCAERVVIGRDDVTLQGVNIAPPPAGGSFGDPLDQIVGDIRVEASSRISIADLSIVNGPNTGVLADRGSSVELFNLRVNGHAGAGIGVSRNSFAQMNNLTVINPSTGFNAVFLNDGGDARIRDSFFFSQAPTADDGAALGLFRSAHARLDGNNIIRNTNASPNFNEALAIQVLDNSNLRIENPGTTGNQIIGNIVVANNSNFELQEALIFGQTGVSAQSRLRVRNTPVNGSVDLFRMSVLQSDGSLPSNVICTNSQSMVTGIDIGAGTGAGSGCTLE